MDEADNNRRSTAKKMQWPVKCDADAKRKELGIVWKTLQPRHKSDAKKRSAQLMQAAAQNDDDAAGGGKRPKYQKIKSGRTFGYPITVTKELPSMMQSY